MPCLYILLLSCLLSPSFLLSPPTFSILSLSFPHLHYLIFYFYYHRFHHHHSCTALTKNLTIHHILPIAMSANVGRLSDEASVLETVLKAVPLMGLIGSSRAREKWTSSCSSGSGALLLPMASYSDCRALLQPLEGDPHVAAHINMGCKFDVSQKSAVASILQEVRGMAIAGVNEPPTPQGRRQKIIHCRSETSGSTGRRTYYHGATGFGNDSRSHCRKFWNLQPFCDILVDLRPCRLGYYLRCYILLSGHPENPAREVENEGIRGNAELELRRAVHAYW